MRLVGLLKTGRKSLFLRGAGAAYCSAQPLCVLDFFVLLQRQRRGLGQGLFQVGPAPCLALVYVAQQSMMQGGGCEDAGTELQA